MTGTYSTIDGCIYEVFFDTILEGKKKINTLMTRCIKSKTKTDRSFPMIEANLKRNILFGTWIKIES